MSRNCESGTAPAVASILANGTAPLKVPMLLYRSRTNEVQEILVEGLPLGLKTAGKYYARNLELYAGDTVLLMTDGLPERLNPENNEYGYPRSMSIFREIAHNSATRICELLAEAGDEWANGREQEDDIFKSDRFYGLSG